MSVDFFFVKQKTAYEMRISDWSSDVCSSDLGSSLTGARWFTRKRETERVPCGMCSSRSSAEISRPTTWSWRPPEPGTSWTTGSLTARQSVEEGNNVAVRVDLGGRRRNITKNIYITGERDTLINTDSTK